MDRGERNAPVPPDPAERDPLEGLWPRTYRARLDEGDRFRAGSALRSTTIRRDAVTPILGTALHHSHGIRDGLRDKLAIDDAARRYEEDPWTEEFLGCVAHTLVPNQSRYEVDMNRPSDTAIYARPELAWGKEVWSEPLADHEREGSLEKWYEFHRLVDEAVADAIDRFGYAVVFDIHSYNYQRDGVVDWRTHDEPVINLGTAHLRLDDRGRDIVDWTLDRLDGFTVDGEPCTVDENAVFYGGYMNRRLARFYGPRCVTLSIEFMKVFMDERTGEVHRDVLDELVAQTDDLVRDLGDRLDAPVRDEPEVPTAEAP